MSALMTEGVGTGAGEGATGQDTGNAWVTRSTDCPEAPAQAHPLTLAQQLLVADAWRRHAESLADVIRSVPREQMRRPSVPEFYQTPEPVACGEAVAGSGHTT